VPENHLSLIDKSVLDDFLANQAKDSGLTYADFRRSLITSGIDLNALVDKEFMVGSARCRGVELCEPCAFLAATVHRGVLPGLVNRGGLRAIIIKSGSAEIGSTITEG
jgi:MOSC domain-containing protein YiiM